MRYVLVALLPKELNDLINPIREQFESGVSVTIPPHVTVLPPFFTDNEILLKDNIKNTLDSIVSFKTTVLQIDFFNKENGGKVGYYSLTDQDNFKKINQLLTSELILRIKYDTSKYPDNDLPEYIPHITFAMDVNDQEIESVTKNLTNIIGREFTIDRLSLLVNEQSGGIWKLERIFILKPFST